MCIECDSDHRPEVIPDPAYKHLMVPWEMAGPPARMEGGWHVWSRDALEAEIVMYADRLLRHLIRTREDLIVIETGVGQGYTTRQLTQQLRPEHDLYWAYESDDGWRSSLQGMDFWLNHLSACIKDSPTPDAREMAVADLVIIDSSKPWSYSELHLWEATGKPDSILMFSGTLPELQVPSLNMGNPKQTHVLSWDLRVANHLWSTLFERRRVTY